jgi:hypothetical protein
MPVRNKLELADGEFAIGRVPYLVQCVGAAFNSYLLPPEKRLSQSLKHLFEGCLEMLEFSLFHRSNDGEAFLAIQFFGEIAQALRKVGACLPGRIRFTGAP